ncbi:MAG: hypothetical protein WKF59_19950 [Chitinophagaceae bacterium]
MTAAKQSAIQINDKNALGTIYSSFAAYYLANDKTDSAFYYANSLKHTFSAIIHSASN